jgi:hypothetical protein
MHKSKAIPVTYWTTIFCTPLVLTLIFPLMYSGYKLFKLRKKELISLQEKVEVSHIASIAKYIMIFVFTLFVLIGNLSNESSGTNPFLLSGMMVSFIAFMVITIHNMNRYYAGNFAV